MPATRAMSVSMTRYDLFFAALEFVAAAPSASIKSKSLAIAAGF
jgi:hypothetical protein